LDRLTKFLALTGVFRLSKNTSLFGLDLNQDWLVWLTSLILSLLLTKLFRVNNQLTRLIKTSYWLIIAGGLSNLFDRLTYGYVIDMIRFFNISVFNLSDLMIMSGCGLIMLETFFGHHKSK